MNQAPTLYNLYCINLNCDKSIHMEGIQTQVIFDIDNLTATHSCIGCHRELYSAMDIEIEQMVSKVGVRVSHKPFLNSNY